ncbi:putative transposase [Escherichia coli 199900.1]|nr:putative transposase [Escherichia coli 199900.1]ENE57386.1 putative transposase [Escherichia coli P0304777.11]ENF10994.1 putative transposase [Escherichia coli P0304777.8]
MCGVIHHPGYVDIPAAAVMRVQEAIPIQSASQKWTMPLKDWRMAMSRFIIEFGDRLDGHF